MGTYHTHNGRVYHGASVSIKEFSEGKNPPAPPVTTQTKRPIRPVVETYPCPDVGRLVAMVQQGQALPPLAPPRPTVNHLAHQACGTMPCTCGVPRQPTGEDMLAVQRAQGKR